MRLRESFSFQPPHSPWGTFFFFNFKFPDVFLETLATHPGSASYKDAFYQVLMPNTGQEMISTLFSSLIGR